MQDTFEFKLSTPLKVQGQVKGENKFLDISVLHLRCFNKKDHRNITVRLRNKFKRMMIGNLALIEGLGNDKSNKNSSKESEGTLDATGIRQGLSMCNDDELIEFHDKFTEFLVQDICFKDEDFKKKITPLEILDLDLDDLEGLISKYIEVFFISLWMKSAY